MTLKLINKQKNVDLRAHKLENEFFFIRAPFLRGKIENKIQSALKKISLVSKMHITLHLALEVGLNT